jgi:hypothetical protein
MIAGIITLIGVLLMWVGITGRGNDMWKAVFGGEFKPFGYSE